MHGASCRCDAVSASRCNRSSERSANNRMPRRSLKSTLTARWVWVLEAHWVWKSSAEAVGGIATVSRRCMALSLVPLTQLSQNDPTLVLVNERSGATPERDPENE